MHARSKITAAKAAIIAYSITDLAVRDPHSPILLEIDSVGGSYTLSAGHILPTLHAI